MAYNMNLGYSTSTGYPGYGQSSYGCLGYPAPSVSSAFSTGPAPTSVTSYGGHGASVDPSLATYGLSSSSLAAAAASSATCDVLSR